MAEERHQLRNGDLLLFRGTRPFSRAVQIWTRSPYSHVGVVCESYCGTRKRLDVLEAMEGTGIRQYPLTKYLETPHQMVDLFRVDTPTISGDAMVDFILDRRGTGYAWRQLLRSFVTFPLAELFGRADQVESERRFCSYLVAEALLAAGYAPKNPEAFVPHTIAPGDLTRIPGINFAGRLSLDPVPTIRRRRDIARGHGAAQAANAAIVLSTGCAPFAC